MSKFQGPKCQDAFSSIQFSKIFRGTRSPGPSRNDGPQPIIWLLRTHNRLLFKKLQLLKTLKKSLRMSKKKIIRKRDENTIITCHRSTDKDKQLFLLHENTQRRLSVKSLTTKTISSFPCTSQCKSLHLVHLHKPDRVTLSLFSGLLGQWGLTGIFCIIYSILITACNTYMYILYYLLYAVIIIGSWSLNKLSKTSHELILPAFTRGGSRKFIKGWLGHLPTCQLYRNILLF